MGASRGQDICTKAVEYCIKNDCQKVCKFYRPVSLNVALALSGLLILDLRIKEGAKIYKATKWKPQIYLIMNRTMETRISTIMAPHPDQNIEFSFQCLQVVTNEILDKHRNGLLIYTDGSTIDMKVETALFCWETGSKIMCRKQKLE